MMHDRDSQRMVRHNRRVKLAFSRVKERMAKVETCLDPKIGSYAQEVITENTRSLDDAVRRFVAAVEQMDYFHNDIFVVQRTGFDDEEE